ncbi:MAG: glycosyltransferase [Lachnospiraceae bacterium]|nr:glycosyltransferase [Lachnospiraceae bacterium]
MEQDYREAYKKEREKAERLNERIEKTKNESAELSARIAHIKGSRAFKAAKPLREVYHHTKQLLGRVGRYGSIKGIASKLSNKSIEKKARLKHGTRSFPDKERRNYEQSYVFPKNIKISILVPLYNTPGRFLKEMIESVTSQTYGNWELCLADGSDSEHAEVGKSCLDYASKDKRIVYKKLEKNEGISGNTNECLKMATGEYIALFDHDDVLHPSALFEYMKAICEEDADYIYCDETTFKGNKSIDHMITLHFKPDFAPDNLRANNYICHFSVFKRKLLEGTELFRTQFDGSQDHDMILRLTAKAEHVVHVPKILYYWRSHKASVAADISAKSYAIDAAKGAVAEHLKSLGYKNFSISSTKAFETIFRIRYEICNDPEVSIIIPNKDHKDDLKRLIDSIKQKSTYENYELVIVENNSTGEDIREYYDLLTKENDNIRVVTYEGDFNFSAICNFGVSFAEGEYILLLNNDMEVITPDWLEELLMYAVRPDVGAVGAKLYYADRTIQHAGVVIGLGAHRTAGHVHYRCADTNFGYMGRLMYAQNFSAVTGACLMVSKKKYDELGGLDESFAVALNDVDFCLRLREKGYLNVWTPFAELYHFESASRGSDVEKPDPAKAARYDAEAAHFRERYAELIESGDPYFNVNFSLDRSDFALKV